MSNRTAKPISPQLARNMKPYVEQIGLETTAYLGNEFGEVPVAANPETNSTSHYGRYWIRLRTGNDNNGNAILGTPQKARKDNNLNYMIEWVGYPVRVRYDRNTGEWVIVSMDDSELLQAGIDTRSNNMFRQLNNQWFRNTRDGRVFVPSETDGGSKLFTIESAYVHWKADNSIYNLGKGISDNLDLSSYIPTAGNERLVLVGERWHDRTIQLIASATRAVTTADYSLSDVQALAIQLDDYAQPLGVFRLSNAQATVTWENLEIDLRSPFQAPQIRGNRNVIDVPVHILEKHQYLIHSTLTIESSFIVDGEVVIL